MCFMRQSIKFSLARVYLNSNSVCSFQFCIYLKYYFGHLDLTNVAMSDQKNKRPGEAALESMKLLQNESSLFKIPKIPKKKTSAKKSRVLDEDVYVEGISKIIQRDFFPDLEKLKAQNEFLEATENKDYTKLKEITIKYSGNQSRPPTEPYNTPATFDTPHIDRTQSSLTPTVREQYQGAAQDSSADQPKDFTENHSLDSFLSTHTSEDNASYCKVIALEEKKRDAKLASQYEAEVTSAALVDAAFRLPSIEEQADQTAKPMELDTWRYKAKNYIMYVPDGAASQPATDRPELVHRNTRLRAEPFDHVRNKEAITAIARTQDATVTGKIGVDGVSISTGEKEEGYPLVGTPSPRPGVGPDQSPLMTWGHIEGTPFRLDGGDTPLPAMGAGAAYRMLEGGARERLALQLAERAARRRRPTTPRPAPLTPLFRTNTERLASMSPAARKLATKHLVSPGLKLTPVRTGRLNTTPRRPTTPLVAKPNTPLRTGQSDNITDNLLQINVTKRTRLKAQDFFK